MQTISKLNHAILSFNRVVLLLTMSDIFTWGVWYIISALAGLYLAQKINADPIQVVGIGTAIYYVSRAVFEIPVGWITDVLRKDRDEIISLMLGSTFMGVPYLFYPMISQEVHFYVLQIVFGFGVALNLNSWRKLFAKNLTPNSEGTEYGVYDMIISLATALFSAIAGIVASIDEGFFDLVLVGVGLLMISSSIWAALIFSIENRRSK